jgi:hypothetical protein
MSGEVAWPEEDQAFLRATLAEANAEIERRVANQ